MRGGRNATMTSTSALAPSARLTWLHLSDFHLRVSTGWSQDAVLSSMLADIRDRYGGAGRPDLVFLTGDIAFSGKEDEYKLAEEFIRKLCSAIDLPLDRLCVVPGNHDIDRDREEDAVIGARRLLESSTEVDRFLGNEGRRRTLFARQEAFRAFANRIVTPPTYSPVSYTHQRVLQVGALRVRVLLLDSAWLASGGPSDAGDLLVGERQVLDCAEPNDECLTFALLHHPFAWLREFEQTSIENLIARSAQVCLRGHVHSPDLRATDGPQGRLMTFTAGAAFQSRTADNTYLWCTVDLMTGLGEKVSHRYRHVEHRWEAGSREPWIFLQAATRPTDLAQTHATLLAAGVRYTSYVTCLVGSVQAEVPLIVQGGNVAFVACEAKLSKTPNRCGELILRLRHHFHWRRIWRDSAWHDQLTALARELDKLFQEVEAIDQDGLRAHDENGQTLLGAFVDTSGISSTACAEIRHLLSDGDLERARAVLERWRGQDILRPDEGRELSRLEIFLLLAEGNVADANERAATLIAASERTPADIALAARCAFDAKEHQKSANLMHDALDAGVAIGDVKVVALAIAGAAGDKQLTERVR